jgi:hypothetical protein
MMTSGTAVGSNVEIIREYTRRVFNEHNPQLASEYVTPQVKWHGGTLGTVEGAEDLVALLRGFIGALPGLNAHEQDIVADGIVEQLNRDVGDDPVYTGPLRNAAHRSV